MKCAFCAARKRTKLVDGTQVTLCSPCFDKVAYEVPMAGGFDAYLSNVASRVIELAASK